LAVAESVVSLGSQAGFFRRSATVFKASCEGTSSRGHDTYPRKIAAIGKLSLYFRTRMFTLP
jgi:hypothetical protein